MILTDARGVPIPRPVRSDYWTEWEYLRAVWRYNDEVSRVAREAFDEALRRSVRT